MYAGRLCYSLFFIVLLFSCSGSKSGGEETATQQDATNAEMKVSLDGTLYVTERVDWQSSHANDVDDQIQFLLWNSEDPVQLNLNINKQVIAKGPATYTIPDDNQPNILIDLNFFNAESKAEKRMNKRVLFRKGTIEFIQISDHALQMKFEGEGSGMMERDVSFPIFGEVNVTY
ncbi:MAG: hypothetical protein KDC93_17540 [Cyclobacteriaceae bacterium]|nr:hypothetical protein [Cyclobacteriaceae bacterium]